MEELDKYEGQVKNGKMHGKGKLTNSKGIIFEGTFENGRPEGEAIITMPDGKVYQLLIKEGNLIERKLIKGSDDKKNSFLIKDPFRPKPGPDRRPKGGSFFLFGLDSNPGE